MNRLRSKNRQSVGTAKIHVATGIAVGRTRVIVAFDHAIARRVVTEAFGFRGKPGNAGRGAKPQIAVVVFEDSTYRIGREAVFAGIAVKAKSFRRVRPRFCPVHLRCLPRPCLFYPDTDIGYDRC